MHCFDVLFKKGDTHSILNYFMEENV